MFHLTILLVPVYQFLIKLEYSQKNSSQYKLHCWVQLLHSRFPPLLLHTKPQQSKILKPKTSRNGKKNVLRNIYEKVICVHKALQLILFRNMGLKVERDTQNKEKNLPLVTLFLVTLLNTPTVPSCCIFRSYLSRKPEGQGNTFQKLIFNKFSNIFSNLYLVHVE